MKIAITSTILLILIISTSIVFAHPGRTATDGCHYCRTNCDKWGEIENERHCHNTDTTSSSDTTLNTSSQAKNRVSVKFGDPLSSAIRRIINTNDTSDTNTIRVLTKSDVKFGSISNAKSIHPNLNKRDFRFNETIVEANKTEDYEIQALRLKIEEIRRKLFELLQ